MLPSHRRTNYTPTRSSPLRSSFSTAKTVRFALSSSSVSPKGSLSMEKDLISNFLPEPEHPRVKWRTAATATLLLFAAYVGWQAVMGPGEAVENEIGLGWRGYEAVQWGMRTKGEEEGQLAEFGVDGAETTEEWAYDGEEETSSSSSESETAATTTSSSASPTATSFSRLTASKVAKALKNGSLSSYKWHATLQNVTDIEEGTKTSKWGSKTTSKAAPKEGRLIIVGDVHGMASSLTALLGRLAYSPDDTLLFVGDLVSKSTLNSSLSTVSLLRQLVPTPSASATAGVKAQKGKQPWSSDVDEEEVERRSDKGVGRVPRKGVKAKRGWFGWGAAASEEQEEEETAADAEEELEEELGYGDESAESSSASSPSISSSSSTTTRRRPFGSQPTATESSASSRPSSALLSAAISVPTSDSTGAFLGPSWAWLDSSSRELRSLGVAVPKGWDWQGEWFEIARHLSSDDARYLEDLPLTLWIEELRTYVVHAGMLPWSSPSQELETLTNEVSAPRPALLNSTSPLAFAPSLIDSQLLDSPERALLLVQQNEDPFTLLTMRTVKAGKKAKGDKATPGGWTVSKSGSKGLPWMKVWESGMQECGKHKSCEKVGVVYGHWAGAGLEIKNESIGLDSGCVYGRRLSALVLPKSSSANFSSSPLNSSSAKSATSHGSIGEAFRHFDKNYTISSHKPLVDPYGSFAPARGKGHGRVANEGKKMERRAPPPAGEPGSWRGRPGVKGWTGAEESTELGAADETPVEEDGDAEDAAVVNSHEGDENEKVEPVEDEDGYEEERVEFAGREGWVVSRDCAADAEAYGLSRRV